MTVDSDTTGQNPVVVFDPVTSNKVHVAYQRGSGANNTIYYNTCTLGGSCGTTPERVSTIGKSDTSRLNPAIATNSAGTPIVLYTESDAEFPFTDPQTWLNYAYESTSDSNFYAFEGGGGGHGTNRFGASAKLERSVSLASLNDELHIAYAEGDSGVTSDRIQYWQMDISALSGTSALGSATAPVRSQQFNPDPFVEEPDFPAISAISGGDVAVVWQVQDDSDSSSFSLAYNKSGDSGASWDIAGAPFYSYIPSTAVASNVLDKRTAADKVGGRNGVFDNGLHPDVAQHNDGSDLVIHATWHQTTTTTTGNQNRTDIMYAYLDQGASSWARTNILTGTGLTPLSTTNVTAFYGFSDDLSKLRPKMLFGNFGSGTTKAENRLQVVYVNLSGSVRRAVYNGWELGSSFISPSRTEQDSDCDDLVDSVEIVESPPSGCTDWDTVSDHDLGGNTDYMNCDHDLAGSNDDSGPGNDGGDLVPDFLDPNTDGDYQKDDVDGDRYSWSTDGLLFLPVILKQ
ncbi:MAG: hypothetical protein GY796_33805 [Chloroflexi bacterium]|nr:hypothetical protein [Chloroflexota bacterium]